nr:RecName: Full=Uncharacterized protein SMPP8 [Nautilus macromphalus]
GPAAVVRLLGK